MNSIMFAIEQDGDKRFETDLALDLSAFCILNGIMIFWGVLFATGLHPFRAHVDVVLGANLALAAGMVAPGLRIPALIRGAIAPKLILLLAYACIACSAWHFSDKLAIDPPAMFMTGMALAALTYLVAAVLALISFKGVATIRIG